VAQILREAIRPYDICARYAGDEFILVLSGCDLEEAERKRQELQDAVARHRFEPCPGQHLTLGISGGLAVFPHDGHSHETLLALADGRMYRDKAERKRAHRGSYATPAPVVAGVDDHLEADPVRSPAFLR
jgi:diguanylate cyclase (GGDEF)-like protein